MSKRKIALFMIVALMLAGIVAALQLWPSARNASKRPVPTDQQLILFQAKADQACLCTRQRGADHSERCWEQYERAVAPYRPGRIGTMCAFGANLWDYFDPDEHGMSDKRVILHRGMEENGRDACTAAEEQALWVKQQAEGSSCG